MLFHSVLFWYEIRKSRPETVWKSVLMFLVYQVLKESWMFILSFLWEPWLICFLHLVQGIFRDDWCSIVSGEMFFLSKRWRASAPRRDIFELLMTCSKLLQWWWWSAHITTKHALFNCIRQVVPSLIRGFWDTHDLTSKTASRHSAVFEGHEVMTNMRSRYIKTCILMSQIYVYAVHAARAKSDTLLQLVTLLC